MMQPHEIKAVVAEVLAEQQKAHIEAMDAVMLKTVATILKSFGIEEDERKELQADFIHLRKWRKSVESAQGLTLKVIVGTIVSGFLAAVWIGVRAMLGK